MMAPAAPTLSLNAEQPVQLSPTISFQTIGIAPGEAHQLPADPNRTRISQDRITVEGDAHGNYPITVAPGESCTVTNDGRVDMVGGMHGGAERKSAAR
jgi:hypothetical protein